LEIHPQFPDALNNKAVALFILGKFKESVESSDKALALNPNDQIAKENKANAAAKL
jgi:tetratricopeptide (TPR) repeat protein